MENIEHFVPQCGRMANQTVTSTLSERAGFLDLVYNDTGRAELIQFTPQGVASYGLTKRYPNPRMESIPKELHIAQITEEGMTFQYEGGCSAQFLTQAGYETYLKPYKDKRAAFISHVAQGGGLGLALELHTTNARMGMGTPRITSPSAGEQSVGATVVDLQKSSWPTSYEITFDMSGLGTV